MTRYPEPVLDFWYAGLDAAGAPGPEAVARWFGGGAEQDRAIAARFGAHVAEALRGGLRGWARRPRGRLALILLLDQFPRNVYRGRHLAFAGDAAALCHARVALAKREDRQLSPMERYFLYMPFEHAEEAAAQTTSVALFAGLLAEAPPALRPYCGEGVDHAVEHRQIFRCFGRFPARNAALGRASSPAERRFLARIEPTTPPTRFAP